MTRGVIAPSDMGVFFFTALLPVASMFQNGAVGSGLRHIEEMPAGTILDFDDPDIGVEFDFLRKPFLDRLFGHRLWRESRKNPVAGTIIFVGRLWCGREQDRPAIEQCELDENGTGFLGAAPPHDGENIFDMATAEVGRDPDAGFQSHPQSVCDRSVGCYGIGFPVASPSSWTNRSEIWPVMGSLRSRSKRWIAACVSAPIVPVGFNWP